MIILSNFQTNITFRFDRLLYQIKLSICIYLHFLQFLTLDSVSVSNGLVSAEESLFYKLKAIMY